jgi:hypothetical protein
MNKFSLLTHMGMIAIAVAIVLIYIQPKISSIRDTQDLITSYEIETEKVSQVNESLRAKIAAIDSIAPDDLQALARFVPATIDEISVLKDMEAILVSQSIDDFEIAYKGNNAGQSSDEEVTSEYGPVTENYFSASFETDYQQLKSLLALVETNDYLMQITNLKISEAADDLVKVDMSLTTFTLPKGSEEITQ